MENEGNYYRSLYEIAKLVNSARSPENILTSIVESVAKAMGVKGCSLMILTPEKEHLLHTAAYGLSDWYIRKGPISVDKSFPEAFDDWPVVIEDATQDERVQYKEQAKKEGIVSILSLPVMLREEAAGLIRVYTAEPRHFTEEDIFFVSAVANLGAIALENARLYDSVQKDYDALRQDLLQWRAALGYEWMAEEDVIPVEEQGPVMPPGG